MLRILKLEISEVICNLYIVNEYDMGEVIDIEKHYPGNYGAPGMPRCKKKKRTPEQIEQQNQRNREKYLQRLILANFSPGDWHLILNYRPKDRPTYNDGRKQVKKFLADMRKAYKKAGYEFKYVYITERGKKGQAVHHHLVIQDIDAPGIRTTKLVKQLWQYGNTIWVDLYEDGEYKNLAEYIVKKETKEECGWASYSRSRNLIKPKLTRKKLRRKKWPEDPKPKKGFYIIKGSILNGINPVTGYPYQHYSMRRIRGGKEDG